MLVTQHTREQLRVRRQKRDLLKNGYAELSIVNWKVRRGQSCFDRIADVQVSADGLNLFIRTERLNNQENRS